MSAQFLQSNTPAQNQTIKVNDANIRGDLELTGTALTGGKITLPELTTYPQATATNANVAASTNNVAPEQFIIKTFETSPGVGGDLASGTSVSFQVFHSGIVANKTMVLVSKSVSANTLLETNAWVSYCADNAFIVTRHNFGATTAVGSEKLIFKLIQTV